jgi:hypothetical protein
MDWSEKRERGRIGTVQALVLRTQKTPQDAYKAFSIDVSEENIGFETDAPLTIGERIRLELTTKNQTVVVDAVVLRNQQKHFGCRFVDDDREKAYKFFTTTTKQRKK